MTIKYYNKPCGIYSGDPELTCFFYRDNYCILNDVLDTGGNDPCSMRKFEMEEFEIMELHQELDNEEQELIASEINPCWLHINQDKIVDAIQFYREDFEED